MRTCVFVRVLCMHVHESLYVHACVRVCVHARVTACDLYVCIYLYVSCMYARVCVCVCVCLCVCARVMCMRACDCVGASVH